MVSENTPITHHGVNEEFLKDEEGGWVVRGPEKSRVEIAVGFISFQSVSLKI